MTEHDHDEIARRLRETGTVPAPDRLRADVMAEVRAEPRLRPARRSFLRPALPYAAAAAIVAALVLAISQLGGSGMNGSAELGAGGGASAADGAGLSPPGKTTPGDQVQGKDFYSLSPAALKKLTRGADVKAHTAQGAVILAVPYARLEHYKQRLRAIESRTRGVDTIRVFLRPTR
jgi:hypothetical protein